MNPPPPEAVTSATPQLADSEPSSNDPSTRPLAVADAVSAAVAASAGAAGLSAAAISCAHYVLSTLILHSPSTLDPGVVFRHIAGTNASSPQVHAQVSKRYAALHLFLAWSAMQIGRIVRRRHLTKIFRGRVGGNPLSAPPWSLLLQTSLMAWSSLEIAQIASLFGFYVLGPPIQQSSHPDSRDMAPRVDILSLIPCATPCEPDTVPDDECSICLGSLVEPEPSRSHSEQPLVAALDEEPRSAFLGSLRPWVYHILHTHARDLDLDLDVDLDLDMLGDMFFHSSSPAAASPFALTEPLQPHDRLMYTICPTGKHSCHAACLQLYIQSASLTSPALTTTSDGKPALRCPTCRTPVPTSTYSSQPSSSLAESTLRAVSQTELSTQQRATTMIAALRNSTRAWLANKGRIVLSFLRHAQCACLVPSRWRQAMWAYMLNWPQRGLFRGLVASLCSAFVLVHFRLHARKRRLDHSAIGS